MSFATVVRNRNTERLVALVAALAVFASMMVVFAGPALAHNGTVSWDCDGWDIDLAAYGAGADITVTVDGVEVDAETGWTSYSNSGSWDDTQAHTLDIVVDAYDDSDQPEYDFTANGSFSPAWQSGEWSFTLDIDLAACNPPQAQTVSVAVSQNSCRFDPVYGSVSEVVITVDPSSGASVTVDHEDGTAFDGTYTSSTTVLLPPGQVTWSAVAASGFTLVGSSGGTFQIDHLCMTCPSYPPGTIVVDLTPAGVLLSNRGLPAGAHHKGPIAVDIPAGFYDVTLSSFDDHTNKPGQETGQQNEQYFLQGSNGGADTGWDSNSIADLPTAINFLTQTVNTDVFIPELDAVFTTHTAGWSTNSPNSIEPVCAAFTPVEKEVDVEVTATSCLVDAQGQPVGDIGITIDPDALATVNVYSDPARTVLVGSVSATGDIEGLAPGTYYWEAEAAPGFTLTGPSQGEVTITDCEVSVDVSGVCVVQGDVGSGLISVEISTAGGATVEIRDSSNALVATVTETGDVSLPEGQTYAWTATAATGFAISGPDSGTVDIEECTPEEELGEIIVQKVVVDGAGAGFAFTFDTVGFTLADNTLAHGESSSSGPLAAGDGYSVAEVVPTGWEMVSAVCDDQSDPSNIDLAAGEVVTCTFTNQIEEEVQASILVTVGGDCDVVDDDGVGLIEVTLSVAGGATVVVRDSDGDVVGTLSADGTISVAEGEVYTWEATPNAGFEFPPGFDSTGSITIETCSNPEVLPFTGIDVDVLATVSTVLLGAGLLLIVTARRLEES